MVGKRRKHKTVVPYRKVVGSGNADVPALVETLSLVPGRKLREKPKEAVLEHFSAADPTHSAAEALPLELVDLIFQFCSPLFPLLFVNRKWYDMALRHVYARPQLTPNNFLLFVQAITNDRKLGSHVRELDLLRIAQVGQKSMTARILSRCSPKLERFVAAQSHFGYLPMVSLAQCLRLKSLDLGLVSEQVDLPLLFRTISNFNELEILYFPRSSIDCPEDAEMIWAKNLRQLGLSGGFPARFLETTEFPAKLTHLQVSNCPYMTTHALISLLGRIGPQLKVLAVTYPMPLLSGTALDSVLFSCPNLIKLSISIDYFSQSAFDPDLMPDSHPLASLTLLSSGMIGHSEKLRPSDIYMATDQLPNLKRVSASLLMGWNPESPVLMNLVELMNDRGGGVWMI